MARKEKNNVDYFPHAVIHGKKMFFIRQKFGNNGYAVWFMLLEHLGKANYHYLDLKDELQLMYLSSEFLISEEVLIEIIETLVKMDEFDSNLWKKEKILYNEKFVDNVKDAYRKRSNSILSKQQLVGVLKEKGRINSKNGGINDVNGGIKAEEIHKGKESILKGKEIKGNQIILSESANTEKLSKKEEYEFLFNVFWDKYDKKVDRHKCLLKWMRLKQTEIEQIFQHVEKYVDSTNDKQYRKNPLTYLNSKSYENEIIESNTVENGKKSISTKYREAWEKANNQGGANHNASHL